MPCRAAADLRLAIYGESVILDEDWQIAQSDGWEEVMAELTPKGTVQGELEEYELALTAEDVQAAASDPTGFIKRVLKHNGIRVNRLLVDQEIQFASGPVVLAAWHIPAPPIIASTTIVVNR
ncbi:hypothetical protein [Streptomyces sp. NPDC056987]|uniref:hypothetical protein n=1 Tax=Streptomyces sp. NPDC056987 TaxID=3345988 RepID=UPI00364506B3